MSRTTVRSLAAGLVFWAVPAMAQQEHARYDFPFVVDGQEHVLTYEGTHDVMRQTDPAVKLVVFVHHGGSQNPVTYFNGMKAALPSAAAAMRQQDQRKPRMDRGWVREDGVVEVRIYER